MNARAGVPRHQVALAAAVFFGLALFVYAPALRGPFVSDDLHYVRDNPYVRALSLDHIREVFDPTGPAAAAVENWSPVHLLLHMLAWQGFGEAVLGHHLLNVALHTLAALLFAALLRRTGARDATAALAGVLFLVHPANVEAVAWISQLKSSSALVLSLAALLLHPRRPAVAALAFGLALLAKPTAAYALPVAAGFALLPAGTPARGTRWLALWALLFAAYAGIELGVFQRSGQDIHPMHPDPFVQARTIATNGGRYLRMALTGRGLSAFHEPVPILAASDPRFLAALAALALLGARALQQLRERRPEAVYWIWAALSFAPISQIFPFLYPVADRYLYFILPGLIGGALLAAQDGVDRLVRRGAARNAGRVAFAAGALLASTFVFEGRARARIWTNPALLFVDSATHYPDGVAANLLRARRAAQTGDADAAAAGLRAAQERGFHYFEQITGDPAFAPVIGDARVRAVVIEMAGFWVERIRRLERPTQSERALLARALALRGERATREGDGTRR